MRNVIFGSHTAAMGVILPLTAKVDEMVWNTMYPKLMAIPIPRFNPMPPLTFFAESERPISVSIKAANEEAMRL